jgi:hypothetical protein
MIKSYGEELKTIYSGLRISRIALSNQSDLSAFFSPQKVNLKICLIPEDDLLRMAKSGLTTSRISKEDLMKPAA